jgi:hypothetical protein
MKPILLSSQNQTKTPPEGELQASFHNEYHAKLLNKIMAN